MSYIAKGFGPFLRGFGQALEKGRVLFLVTASISPLYKHMRSCMPSSRLRRVDASTICWTGFWILDWTGLWTGLLVLAGVKWSWPLLKNQEPGASL